MRYFVGYGPEQRGIDAVNLAATMARSSAGTVDLVVVLPDDAPTFHMYSPDQAYNEEMRKEGAEWLADGLARVPQGVASEGHLQPAPSIAEGLMEQAGDPDRGALNAMIVVGTSHHFRLGSIAGALLHSASVPVALAPTEYPAQPGITQITCATGLREGDDNLVDFAIHSAAEWKVPLRLVSLVAVGESGSEERQQEWSELARLHLTSLAEKAATELPPECAVSTVVGRGDTMVDAISALDVPATEVVMVGSSRLAQPKRLFLGRTATKIVRTLHAPVIVVPRDYEPAQH